MGKFALRKKHFFTILRHDIASILEVLGLRKFLKRSIERNKPLFNEEINIFKGNKSIVVFPNIPWDYRWQRPQQIFSRLGKKNYNVFYISPITSDKEYIVEVSKGVYEVHIKADESTDVLRDLEISESMSVDFFNSIDRLIGEYINNKSALTFVLHPIWWNVVDKFKDAKIVYDMMDLYSGFKEAKEELVKAEEDLVKKSKLVITTADNLYDYAKKLNENVEMVRNGCDFEKFNDIKKNGCLDVLDDRPIIGYFGAINDWFDVDALEYAVRENKDKYFVMIGSINTGKVRKLYKYKNIYFLGEMKHDELGGYLAYFDVCTIPFVLNDLIKSTNPVKFYEYIASGKPVVSSKLLELERYAEISCLYDSNEGFSKCIYHGLHSDEQEAINKRIEVAKENSWEERVESLESAILDI